MATHAHRDPNASHDTAERTRLDLKPASVVAGVVASIVAALLGSRLGVQGTLLGAALSSLVFGLISPTVTFGIERSREGLRGPGLRRATAAEGAANDRPATPDAPVAPPPNPASGAGATRVPGPRRRRPFAWVVGFLVTTAAVFGITLGVLTALEAGTGRSVDGAHRTTVQAAVQGDAVQAAVRSDAARVAPAVPASADEATTTARSTTKQATPATATPAGAAETARPTSATPATGETAPTPAPTPAPTTGTAAATPTVTGTPQHAAGTAAPATPTTDASPAA